VLTDDDRRGYAARQYDSIREACNQAREAHQSILNWSEAVTATLFAAGLVAVSSNSGRFVLAAQFIFGLVLPSILIGGALAWAGEMIRMETIGLYLRVFERAAWGRATDQDKIDTSWFVWENFIWSPPRALSSFRYGKQATAYAGVALFYTVMYAGSLIVFWIISPWWLSVVQGVLAAALALVVMIPPGVQVLRLGSTAPTISDEDLAEWARELLDDRSTGGRPTPLRYLNGIFDVRTRKVG
jgi:hypothetical protein